MSTKYVAMQQVKDASLSDMINIENIQATHTDTVFENSSTTTNFILTVPFLESRDFNNSGFIVFTPTISNGSPLVVTVNGQRLTAVNSSGLALSVGTLNANMVCVGKIYNDKFYFLDIGNWGASSSTTNAVPSDVLFGKKFLNMNGLSQTGSMPNNGNADNAIVSGTLRSGYTSGGKITNLLAENVKNGINIGGIIGSFQGEHIVNMGIITSVTVNNSSIKYCGNRIRNTSNIDNFFFQSSLSSTYGARVVKIENLGYIPSYLIVIKSDFSTFGGSSNSATGEYMTIFKRDGFLTIQDLKEAGSNVGDASPLTSKFQYMSFNTGATSSYSPYNYVWTSSEYPITYNSTTYGGITCTENLIMMPVGGVGSSYTQYDYFWIAIS